MKVKASVCIVSLATLKLFILLSFGRDSPVSFLTLKKLCMFIVWLSSMHIAREIIFKTRFKMFHILRR